MSERKLQVLEFLLREFRDDSVDREEFDKRESLRFDAQFECDAREIPLIEGDGTARDIDTLRGVARDLDEVLTDLQTVLNLVDDSCVEAVARHAAALIGAATTKLTTMLEHL